MKPKINFITLCIFILLIGICKASIFSWIFGSNPKNVENPQHNQEQALVAGRILKSNPNFELKLADEKFLLEAQKLSPLDVCHHVIIAKLRSSCSELTEEDMGKLSVQLLNCQSEAENRKIYPCSDEMTIADCTTDMDPVVWNAYQIVSNRARAMCYSIKQQQFRLKTEFTVNKLVSNTEDQLIAMDKLIDSQAQIKSVHADTLLKMVEGQQELMSRQELLKSTQVSISGFISSNLRDLYKEKALIAAGHKELAELTEQIKEKLDNTSGQLAKHENEQRNNHEELLEDLSIIREKAKEVWQKIDDSSKHVLEYQEETTRHYEEMMENLKKVNQTITYVLSTIEEMKTAIYKQLTWLSNLIGGAGDQISVLYTCVMHIVYFMAAAISAAFLGAPRVSRILLLILVPLNAISEIKHGNSLNFIGMTVFIALTVVANWCYAVIASAVLRMTNKCHYSPTNCYFSPQKKLLPAKVEPANDVSVCSPHAHNDSTIIENSYSSTETEVTPANHNNIKYIQHLLKQVPPTPTPSQSSVMTEFSTTGTPIKREMAVNLQTPNSISTMTPIQDRETSIMSAASNCSGVISAKDQELSKEVVRRHLLKTAEGTSTPKSKAGSIRSRSSRGNNSLRQPCLSTTRSGQPCKLPCIEGQDFCHVHFQAN